MSERPSELHARHEATRSFLDAVPSTIEASEREGQQSLGRGEQLPIESNWASEKVTAETGIEFGEKADDLFVNVALPAGWRIVATEHSLWSDLVDAHDFIRASIFYKAAFYDRRADIRWADEPKRIDE